MTGTSIALAILGGLLLGQFLQAALWVWAALALSTLIGGLVLYTKTRQFTLQQALSRRMRLFFYLCFMFLAAARTTLIQGPPAAGHIINYVGREEISFNASVSIPPLKQGGRVYLRVRLDAQQLAGEPDAGMAELVLIGGHYPEFEYGSQLRLSGKPTLPPDGGGFSYRNHLQRNGVSVLIYNPHIELLPGNSGNGVLRWIYRLRALLIARVSELFPHYEDALMNGILLGDETAIPAYIERDFQKTGTAHIIAISGANFALLTWLLLSILCRLLRRWWAPLTMLPFIAFYTVLVGGNPAVTRAALMCALTMTGMVAGRQKSGITSLLMTAAVMGLFNPLMLYDVGFQLSVVATLGILLFSDPLRGQLERLLKRVPKLKADGREHILNFVTEWILLSISAQVLTIWISASAFDQISLISPLANLLIAPLQSWIMLGGLLALVSSFIFMPLGQTVAWLVWPAPALTIRIVQMCGRLPWAARYARLSTARAWLIIAVIVAGWYFRKALFSRLSEKLPRYALAGLGFATLLLWQFGRELADERLQISWQSSAARAQLSLTTPQYRRLIAANGQSNFSAQDMFERQGLFAVPVEAAIIEFTDEWMEREFTAATLGGQKPHLFLNTIPEGLSLEADGVRLSTLAAFMQKHACLVNYGEQALLFPMGVPPERIMRQAQPRWEELSLIVLGKQDEPEAWQSFSQDGLCPGRYCASFPQILDASALQDLRILSDGESLELSYVRE